MPYQPKTPLLCWLTEAMAHKQARHTQLVFPLSPKHCVLGRKAVNTKFGVIGVTLPRNKLKTSSIQGKYAIQRPQERPFRKEY